MSHCENVFKFCDDKCPLYMKDIFDKSCIGQASTRNSTMKLNQPLRITNYGQHYISLSWPHQFGTTCRMNYTNVAPTRRKFLCYEDVNKNPP